MKPKSLFNVLRVFTLMAALGALLITFSSAAEAQEPETQLVLWNRLGSQAEVENSVVGLGGVFNGGSFVPGMFGDAFSVDHTQKEMVKFPKEVIPIEAGTIEFWAKLTGFPETMHTNPSPNFVWIVDVNNPANRYSINLGGNDGRSNGGLTATAGAGFTTGTGHSGVWTYEQVLGTGQVESWHHYALVWDKNGIPGVDDGTRNIAVFLDGQLNSGRWETVSGADFVPLTGGEVALMWDNLHAQGQVAFDNLKIWDAAKTDFSGRFTEGILLDIAGDVTEAYPGDTVNVDLNVIGANDLYGLQAECTVLPSDVLAIQSGDFGDFFTNPLIGANDADADAGTWFGGLSLQNPTDPLAGNGLFATLTYQALDEGASSVACDPLASDEDGFELPIAATDETITVLAFGAMNGEATYQGRLDQTDIDVTFTGPTTGSVPTNDAGQFDLGDLRAGDYEVQADAALYLPNCITDIVANDETTILPGTELRGGDTNDNNNIKIGDATLLGSNFGLDVPDADPNADINGDGAVNVQDLSIVGRNFGLEGCQAWGSQ